MRGDLKMFLASVYHPHEENLYRGFNDILTSLLRKAPPNAEKMLGQDINANVGIREDSDELNNVIGPHGFDNAT
jgi:hypothetical protein